MVIVNSSDDQIPLAQSPSITQETKARFNQLLNEALSREVSSDQQFTKSSNNSVSKIQSVSVPKVAPRKKLQVKTSRDEEEAEQIGGKFITYSSEESSGNRKSRQIIAEVHSSQTHLLQSSSDDDILAEKKTKKKKRKGRWKQMSGSPQIVKAKEEENLGFQIEEEIAERSSSRLSKRSYIIETPTIPVENLISVDSVHDQSSNNASPSCGSNRSYVVETPTFPKESLATFAIKSNPQDFNLDKGKRDNFSPSRISNRSYTIEIPTIPVETYGPSEVKPPVPLPRRISLKSIETDPQETSQICKVNLENSHNDSAVTIFQTDIDDDLETPRPDVIFQESYSHHTEDDGEMPIGIRKQKKKKKRKKHLKSREEIELQELMVHSDKTLSVSQTEEKTISTPSVRSLIEAAEILDQKETPVTNGGEGMVGITIHGVDCPLIDPLVRHPMVCLYVVDTSVGELKRKSDPARSVCYNGENTTHILPIMTHMFDFYQRKSVTPAWEECLVLNESPPHLLAPSTLLLFELCDVVPPAVASMRHTRLGGAAGRHTAAWAFLRPATQSGGAICGRKLRLQLYTPGGQTRNTRPLTPVVYEWWGTAARAKYPGSLYVTVMQMDTPAVPPSPGPRSQSALQRERGSPAAMTASASAAGSDTGEGDDHQQEMDATKRTEVRWSRMPGQSCKVPNARFQSLPVDGSMSVQFSGDGLWLACGKQDIQVYSVPEFQHTSTLTGHQGLVYCLRWSSDSKILLSASADCTVCVWRPLSSRNPLLQMLAHPSFVYCAEFVRPLTLVSGCCDAVVRVWTGAAHGSLRLVQQLLGHSGFVSSLCTSVDGSRVITADSHGSLRVYDIEEDGSLSVGRELRVRELRGVVISNVITHPGGHRLLVHSRDSTLRSVDLATGATLHTFKGCVSERMQTGMCVSACGSLVLGCGEDGAVVVWDGHTGALRAVYCGLLPPGSAGVHYHPHDHLAAVAALAQPPLLILGFDRNATGEEIGLHMLKNQITAADVIETMKLIKNSNKWQKAASKALHKPHISIPEKAIGKEKKKKTKIGNPEESSGTQAPITNWPSLPQLECLIEKPCEEKDLRLLEIIRKMDRIILAAKQSSQIQQ